MASSAVPAATVLEAFEANLWVPFACAVDQPWARLADEGDVRWAITGIPMGAFNAVLRARLFGAGPAVEARMDAIDACFPPDLPMSWWLLPTSRPRDLGRRLERRGFVLSGPLPVLGLSLDGWHPPAWPDGLDVELVGDATGFEEACRVVALGYPVPWEGFSVVAARYGELVAQAGAMRCFVAHLVGRAIASATAMLDGGVVGLWNVATLPDARHRGAATAVTLAALDDARRSGARLAVLASTDEALPLYRRLGFQRAGELVIAGRG